MDMASYQAKPYVSGRGRQPSTLRIQDYGKRCLRIQKERLRIPCRRSARLLGRHIQRKHVSPSSTDQALIDDVWYSPQQPKSKDRKRKRSGEIEGLLHCPTKHLEKRQRQNLTHPDVDALNGFEQQITPVEHWIWRRTWPKEYFTQASDMNSLLARKKSTSSLRRKASETSMPSDQVPREEKSAKYNNPRYRTVLETMGSYMDKSDQGIADDSGALITELLHTEQPVHDESLFRNDLFDKTCRKIQSENEARFIRDIGLLIVPSAKILTTHGATELECLIEGVNREWNRSIPFYGPRPQPDYSVGLRRSAFTDDQLERLKPYIGDWDCTSFFMATDTMYFPFFTCEVKCGDGGLEVADRQNAHSMTIALRGMVQLYRAIGREKELHQKILCFSISHDHTTVRIYGHYVLIDEKETTVYRHPIRNFSFTELDGKERWTAYKFTRNVYHNFTPIHMKRICSAIDQIPSDFDFDITPSEHQFSQQSSACLVGENESQPSQASFISSADVTPNTSFTQNTVQALKRPRKKK